MIIERTDTEIIVRLSPNVDMEDLQDFLNYARYKELTAGFQVAQSEVDELAREINKDWWSRNRERLLK